MKLIKIIGFTENEKMVYEPGTSTMRDSELESISLLCISAEASSEAFFYTRALQPRTLFS